MTQNEKPEVGDTGFVFQNGTRYEGRVIFSNEDGYVLTLTGSSSRWSFYHDQNPLRWTCGACLGSGTVFHPLDLDHPYEKERCEKCNGTGITTVRANRLERG